MGNGPYIQVLMGVRRSTDIVTLTKREMDEQVTVHVALKIIEGIYQCFQTILDNDEKMV